MSNFTNLAHVRPEEFWIRQRLYILIERINRTKSIWQRLNYYSPRVNRPAGQTGLSPNPPVWLLDWRGKGIDLSSFPSTDLNHYNREIIQMMAQHGSEKFYLDDIWDIDWESIRRRLVAGEQESWPSQQTQISQPNIFYRTITLALVALVKLRRKIQATQYKA